MAGLGSVRIVAGLMLALGPFFIAFLMFENTRSLFEGWIRVLAGAALAVIGVSIALGLELALMEPWLSDVLARRMAGEALPTVATELFVIACLFAMIVAAALYACVRVTRAFRLAPLGLMLPVAGSGRQSAAEASAPTALSRDKTEAERSRAAAVASILVSTSRRERDILVAAHGAGAAQGIAAAARASNDPVQLPVRIGRSFTRRPNSRVSAIAAKRDAGG